jgi:hypothetical protein
MIRKDRGDGHLYELAYPRLSLLHARIEFINAISATAPEVFERLHADPLEAYKESGLLKLKRKQRAEFWERCYGGGHPAFYFHGHAPIEPILPHMKSDRDLLATSEMLSTYRKNGGTEELRQELLLPGGDRRRITYWAWSFLSGFGLDYKSEDHCEHFNKAIRPKVEAWMASLETWAAGFNLNVGWMLHWAWLKLDSYADQESRPYESLIYQEMSFPIRDIFGNEIQPPVIRGGFITNMNLHDFWIEPFEFTSDFWRPLIQSEEEYVRRVRDDFESKFKRHLEDSKRYLEWHPGLKNIWGKTELAHYEWLARYQCANATVYGLAKEADRTRPTVQQAIEEVAEFIGLPLRPANPRGTH